MGFTDKIQISGYLSSLTLNTAVVIVCPIGPRHATDTFTKNVYSAGSTLSQCDTSSHYQPASTADKARETTYQTPLRSSLYEQLKESCEFCDVFEKHLELFALYFPVYHASSPRTTGSKLNYDNNTVINQMTTLINSNFIFTANSTVVHFRVSISSYAAPR
jgi:hypothetical protein